MTHKLDRLYDIEWFRLAEDMKRSFNSPTHCTQITGLHHALVNRAWHGIEVRVKGLLIICYHMKVNPVDYVSTTHKPMERLYDNSPRHHGRL